MSMEMLSRANWDTVLVGLKIMLSHGWCAEFLGVLWFFLTKVFCPPPGGRRQSFSKCTRRIGKRSQGGGKPIRLQERHRADSHLDARLGRNLVACSWRLDAGGLDDPPPLLDLRLVGGRERLRCLLLPRRYPLAELGEARSHRGGGERRNHGGV